MPDLDSPLHLEKLAQWRRENSFSKRMFRALRPLLSRPLYGLEWGDPEQTPPLRFIKSRYVLPYINARHRAVEIGPGGGRWTQYLLGFETVYAVDYYQEMLDELKRAMRRRSNLRYIKNSGVDFPGIETGSIDYVFSYGTFVHLELDVIEAYLRNIRPIVKPAANIVIHYSDKTKVMAQHDALSENTPGKMREAVHAAGYRIVEEDTTSLWHSSIIRFTP